MKERLLDGIKENENPVCPFPRQFANFSISLSQNQTRQEKSVILIKLIFQVRIIISVLFDQ